MYNQIAVIGIGGFGTHVVKELAHTNFSVIAIDKDREAIDKIKDIVDKALIIDTTMEYSLSEINWKEIDITVVAIGDPNLEASILTVALLKQMGVKRIVSRASTEIHSRVLSMVGSDEIINPEKDMAKMFVTRISMPNVIDLRYFDEQNTISEVIPPDSFIGKSIIQLDLRKKLNISVVAIKRFTKSESGEMKHIFITNPNPNEQIHDEDVIVVIGTKDDIKKISRGGI